MSYSSYEVPCRVCGAGSHERCRTREIKRVTDTHQDRIWMNHRYRSAVARYELSGGPKPQPSDYAKDSA